MIAGDSSWLRSLVVECKTDVDIDKKISNESDGWDSTS